MNSLFAFFGLILISLSSYGQPQLKPAINKNKMPKDWAMIAYNSLMKYAPMPDFEFESNGPVPGDTIPDFTLYTLSGRPVNIGKELSAGKPVLMISASYTCWEFREMMPFINQIDSMYGEDLAVFIIYTAEAHPIDTNPYTGSIYHNGGMWFDGNVAECVLFKQPRTYGERKEIVKKMRDQMTILPEVIIDGPDNEWWHCFGPAANNAYLVNINGRIVSKYAWLKNGPEKLLEDIEKLLVHQSS